MVFGHAGGFAANIDLSTLDGTTGFTLTGGAPGDQSGMSVASAGDVNGDGYDDLIVGAGDADPNGFASGTSYIVYGASFDGVVTTTGTSAAEVLMGGSSNDVLTGGGGADVFHAGSGNDRIVVADLTFRLADGGDGTDTLALAGAGLTLDLRSPATAAKLESIERIDLRSTGNNTLRVDQFGVLGGVGAVTGGKHVLAVEGDASDTVRFGDFQWTDTGSFTDVNGTFDRYVFGTAEVDVEHGVAVDVPADTTVIHLSSLDGTTGFTIQGDRGGDRAGSSVASAGDVNGDGFDDLIVGAQGVDPPDGSNSGAAYVVFGKAGGFPALFDLSHPRRQQRLPRSARCGMTRRPKRLFGGLGRRRQRRRLRRCDRRRQGCRSAWQPFGRELCGIWQVRRVCRQPRPVVAGRQHRLQAQRRGGARL